jgi:hypothetical protein
MLFMNDVLIAHHQIVFQHMLKHENRIHLRYITGQKEIVLESNRRIKIIKRSLLKCLDVIDVKNQLKHIMV